MEKIDKNIADGLSESFDTYISNFSEKEGLYKWYSEKMVEINNRFNSLESKLEDDILWSDSEYIDLLNVGSEQSQYDRELILRMKIQEMLKIEEVNYNNEILKIEEEFEGKKNEILIQYIKSFMSKNGYDLQQSDIEYLSVEWSGIFEKYL